MRFSGTLAISGNATLETINLSGYETGNGVTDIRIEDNAQLTSIEALPALPSGANLTININPKLRSVNVRGSEFRVVSATADQEPCSAFGRVEVFANDALERVDFDAVDLTWCEITVSSSPKLTRLTGLEVSSVRNVSLIEVPALTNVSWPVFGVQTLLVSNTGFTTLSLPQVRCRLEIDDNAKLLSISASSAGADYAANSVLISGNPKLPTCAAQAFAATLPLVAGNACEREVGIPNEAPRTVTISKNAGPTTCP